MSQAGGGLILVTGANGYIASRLIPRLLEQQRRVRVLARTPALLNGRAWASRVEVMAGDTRDPIGLAAALEGVETAYYLIHSMASGRGYLQVERESARRFAEMANRAGLRHIIYLGGLADPKAKNIAPHMRSRIETGEILRRGRVPVTEFRAGVIVGPGSISFEMIRFLTEFFPILPGPRWLRNRVQPIAASNVIDYLAAAVDRPEAWDGIYEMGGPEQMLYADTLLRYARVRDLRRRIFTLPGLPIWLMAAVVDRLTPVPYSIATPLVGGLQSDSIVLDEAARRAFPEIRLISYAKALNESLADLRPERIERVWEGLPGDVIRMRHEGFFIDHRRMHIGRSAEAAFAGMRDTVAVKGWPHASWLWLQRRGPDKPPRVGHRQAEMIGQPDPPPRLGEAVDGFEIEVIEPGCMLRLRAAQGLPGEGWMEWRVHPVSDQSSLVTQTAFFAPRGLPGLLYWSVLGLPRRLTLGGLIRAIKRRCESQ